MSRRLLTLTAALLCTGAATAQNTPAPAPKTAAPSQPAVTLRVGDKAPPLTIAEWVKGEPITGFEKGKVYVVEFWATWCGPCIRGMPHLSALQREFKNQGLTVISVTSEDPRNSLEQVKQMVAQKGDTMGYTVAWDTGRETNNAYMKAAGQTGIPASFLVDQNGTIVYIGHPMWLDKPVADVLAGKWDIKAGNEAVQKAEKQLNAIYNQAESDPKAALKAFEALEKDWPKVAESMADFKASLSLQAGDSDAWYADAKARVEKAIAAKDAMTLNEIAWTIVDPQGNVEKKDLDLAMKAAAKGSEFAGGKDAAILDTLARVYYLKGDLAKAVEVQTQAVSNAQDQMKAELQTTLDEYKAALAKKRG